MMKSTIMKMISRRPRLWPLLVAIVLLPVLLPACDALAPPTSADVGRRPPSFTEVYPYTDGLEVQVSEVWIGRRLGIPVVELTVTITNNSTHMFEAWISGDLRYGRYRLPAVRYLTPPGPDDQGSVQQIAIGEASTPYRLCFAIPPGGPDELMLDVAIDAGAHDPAAFVGRI
jgi:hypothetical protein